MARCSGHGPEHGCSACPNDLQASYEMERRLRHSAKPAPKKKDSDGAFWAIVAGIVAVVLLA